MGKGTASRVGGALLLALSVLCACRDRRGARSTSRAGVTTAGPAESVTASRAGVGLHEYRFQHGGIARVYQVYAPRGYDRGKPLPVWLAIHGGGGNAQRAVGFFGLQEMADTERFLIVYPEGTGKRLRGNVFGSWNAGGCCPPAVDQRVDDVGYFDALLERVQRDFAVDSRRIFASGHSNGALMSYRLACELSKRIAAIAVGGAHDSFRPCKPARAVPVMHFHGTEDQCAPYRGGQCGGCFSDYLRDLGLPAKKHPWACRSVPDFIAEWRQLDGCTGEPELSYQRGKARCERWAHCEQGAEVVLCTVDGMGHRWPGSTHELPVCKRRPKGRACTLFRARLGAPTTDLDANAMAWKFFQRHPMPP